MLSLSDNLIEGLTPLEIKDMVINSVQSKKLLVRVTLDGHISKGVWAHSTGCVGLARSFLLPN
jgi:hypothetical protein